MAFNYAPPNNQHSVHFEWCIQQFIAKVNSRNDTSALVPNTPPPLSAVKQKLIDASSAIKALRNDHNRIKDQINTMTITDWDTSISSMAQRRLHLQNLFNSIPLASVQAKQSKRLRKRRRLQRIQADRLKCAANVLTRRQELHKQIDAWQNQCHLEDAARKQAQSDAERIPQVLITVTKKQSDARKQIDLLDALIELRRVRSTQATGTGANASESEERQFVLEIEKLKTVWNDALQNYQREGDELRLCIAPSHESIREDWQRVLFGADGQKDLLSKMLKRGQTRADALVDVRYVGILNVGAIFVNIFDICLQVYVGHVPCSSRQSIGIINTIRMGDPECQTFVGMDCLSADKRLIRIYKTQFYFFMFCFASYLNLIKII